MSSTAYTVALNLGTDVNNEGSNMTFTSASGMTDDLAIALAQAIASVPWPAQSNASVTATRTVTDQTRTQANLTTGLFV